MTTSEGTFTRSVRFRKGYDCKNEPCKHEVKGEHGIAGVELSFSLLGEKGATEFKLLTNWYPDSVKQMPAFLNERTYRGFPSDLGHHWPIPTYNGEHRMDYCNILHPDDPELGCYYDGSSLAADAVFERLIREGDEAVWEELEQLYASLAQPAEAASW